MFHFSSAFSTVQMEWIAGGGLADGDRAEREERGEHAARDDGERHADLNAVARDDGHFDGWSASVRLLDAPLRTAASTAAKPLAVWTVDDEPSLRRAFSHGPDDVVTNRARWARRTLERWRKEECTHSR